MSTQPIIEVRGLSKRYRIMHGGGSYIALRDVLTYILHNPFRYFFRKVKDLQTTSEEFWALKDVSFAVERGEVIGVIGANGAGKSTLLKILSQITPPTEGEVVLRGRVSSLLEVGTGFHPELTGRENIYLNGAILGMSRKEITQKFQEIVTFAGVEEFLDTPVKYYSSGMYVRLAFSVAAHIDPDILIVDEVLAVGDAEFQKKCLGKMEDVTQREGRTILFVSHNMSAIQSLCRKTLLLEKGRVKKFGPTHEVIDYYLNKADHGTAVTVLPPFHPNREDRGGHLKRISIFRADGSPSVQIPYNESFSIEVEYEVRKTLLNAALSLSIQRGGDQVFLTSDSDSAGSLTTYEAGTYTNRIEFPARLLNVGSYFFDVLLHQPMVLGIDQVQNLYFEITDVGNPRAPFNAGDSPGIIGSILPHVTKRS